MKIISIFILFLIFSVVNSKERPAQCAADGIKEVNSRKSSRIAGGEAATSGQFPWHVHMTLYDDFELKICGGALIGPKWVLTSGLCIVCASSAILHFGIVNRLSFDIAWMTHVSSYNHFIVHENYDIRIDPLADNIGLIFMQNGGNFLLELPTVAVIELPNDFVDETFAGFLGSAAGFGATEDPPTHSSPVLKYTNMTIMSNAACSEFYQGPISDSKVCTDTTEGRSTCHGDFGAPLTAAVDDKEILVGIGSLRNFDGCQVGAPAVFTRVTEYLEWIDRNTNEEPTDEIDCSCDCICHTCPDLTPTKVEL